MRNDAQTQPERNRPGPLAGAETRPAPPPRAPARQAGRLKVPALLTLVAATCWVVATWASVWLVPPYLGVMALLLWPSPGATRRAGDASRMEPAPVPAGSERSEPDGDASSAAAVPSTLGSAGGTADAGPAGPQPAGETGSALATAKPKRGRSRPRKVSRPSAEPVEVAPATWVEVGPGKFVRVETAMATAPDAGPHLAVEPAPGLASVADFLPSEIPGLLETATGPAGPEADPELAEIPEPDRNDSSLEVMAPSAPDSAPDFAAEPTDDAVGATEIAPAAPEITAERYPDLAVDAGPEPILADETDPQAPTIDGIALQVDGEEEPVFEAEDAWEPAEIAPEPEPEDGAFWPQAEPEGQSRPAAIESWDAVEATDEDLTEPSRPLDDEFAAEPEPEDALDSDAMVADLSQEDCSDDWDHPTQEDEVPGCGTTTPGEVDVRLSAPEASEVGPSAPRSRRLSPLVRVPRVVLVRGAGRSSPSGRLDRPPRSPRRPTGPRRPPRRSGCRPRQITRTFPPRSPPGRGRWW